MHKVGRRKCSIANVKLVLGTGQIIINKKSDHLYFQKQSLLLSIINSPLKKLQAEDKYDIYVNVTGGGLFSQAYAIRLGIARALTLYPQIISDRENLPNNSPLSVANAEENKIIFKHENFLTRDPRVKERRKYGLKKARKASQFSKR